MNTTKEARIMPYHSTQTTWKTILDNINIIPMNQRNYEWSTQEINKFINDIFEIYENTNYYEKMGTIIYYTGNPEGKEVWDGQQRLITIILLLVAISRICKLLHNDTQFSDGIINSISESLFMINEPSKRIYEIIQKYGENSKIPKVCCICPHDNKAIIDIYNYYNPLIYYIKTPDCNEEDSDEDDDISENDTNTKNIECKICNHTFSKKVNFIKHLTKNHEYDDKTKNKQTKIYTAFEHISQMIFKKNYDSKKFRDFYKFITQQIDIQVCECNDLQYVSIIFDQENNRGLKVGSLDVIKNKILSNISDENKDEIFDIWSSLKTTSHPIYSDFGQRVFNCAIQIYNNSIVRHFNQEELFDKLIIKNDKKTTYNEIKNFIAIVEKLFDIIEQIFNNRYGRLIFTKKCSITWEGFMYLLLPILYFKNSIDNKLIEIIVRWYYRNINTGKNTQTFNSLGYSNAFIEISNKVINNNNHDYVSDIINLFRKEKAFCIQKENYESNNINKEWKGNNAMKAKMLLYFLQTKLNNDDNLPILNHDLEHIHSDNKKTELSNISNVYKLGNLTILEAKKSENGHKGNRSIKDSPFHIKKLDYKMSSHSITRDLNDYNDFTDETIVTRTKELFKLLNNLTDY